MSLRKKNKKSSQYDFCNRMATTEQYIWHDSESMKYRDQRLKTQTINIFKELEYDILVTLSNNKQLSRSNE